MSLLWVVATAGKAVFHPQFPVHEVASAQALDFDSTRGDELGRGMFEHDGDHPDYYDHLSRHIREHGIKDPIHLVKFPEHEGGGYGISEGHHRSAIAQEQRLPHMPAWVHHPVVSEDGDVDYPSLDQARVQMKWDPHWDALRKFGDD